MFRCALCSSPSIWMRVLTGASIMSLMFALGVRVGTGALVKISGFRSISMMSACLVTAQNSGYFSTSTFKIGDSSRIRLAFACHSKGSAYAAGFTKMEPRFSTAALAIRSS